MILQEVDIIDYHLSLKDGQHKRDIFVKDKLNLNEYRFRPNTRELTHFRAYPSYSQVNSSTTRSGNLFYLEGYYHEDIALRQYIPSLNDVISSTQDSSPFEKEFMVFLNANGELFLIDQIISQIVLGKSSIPIIKLPERIPETTDKKGSISVEFIHKKERPPFDVIPESVTLNPSSQGGSFFVAGDLAVVYTDSENKRHLLKYISRDVLRKETQRAYERIDIMLNLKSIAKQITSTNTANNFTNQLQRHKNEGPLIDYEIYSVILEEGLHKLLRAHHFFQARIRHLNYPMRSAYFNLAEWRVQQTTKHVDSETQEKGGSKIYKVVSSCIKCEG